VDTSDGPGQINHSRRRFLGTAGAAALAVGATQLGIAGGAMAQANAAVRPSGAKALGKRAGGTAIWPFAVPITPKRISRRCARGSTPPAGPTGNLSLTTRRASSWGWPRKSRATGRTIMTGASERKKRSSPS
jgi:hypothetical protein